MEPNLRRTERSTAGKVPKKFDDFVYKLPQASTMYRTPVKEVPALSHDAAIPGPSEVGAAHARVHSESGDNARSKTGNMSCRSRRSISSRKSVVSETVSQIRALELENQLEKEELEASLRVDQIRAQQKLEELKIQKDLEMQLEKKKSEFQRRRIEREIQINELKSVSRSSIHSSPDRRVRSWVEDIPDGHEQPNPPPRFDPPVDRGSGQTEVVTQALKALQYRAVRDLPQFNGNLMEWPIFENEFNISTVEFALSSQDNLRRLNKALHGKARQCVEALLTSAENVNQIMKLLKTNFGRTEWIVSNRLDMLRNLETVREGNIESFRTFFNAVTGTAVALKNVNAEMYLMNPELIAHLADKLPTFSKQMWIRHKASLTRENRMITFDIFSGWLEDELDNQLASVNPTFLSRRQAPVQRVRPPVFQVSNTAADSRSQCPLCSSEEHPGLKQCEKFLKMSIEQRRSTVRGCKACYLCLEVDHSRRNCKSNKTCSICKKNHHQLVHPGNDSKQPVLTVGGTCNTIVGCNTILRVGKVRIRSKTKTEEVFALFDEGSSLTMLDSSIAKEMDLQGTVSPISYRWTNGITHTDDTSMIISLQISGPSDQAVWHKMNNVRTIKNMKLSQMNFDLAQIRQLYPLLDEEKLKVIENATPRMLIGSNNAGLIVPLKTIQYSIRGLQLTRCHLGWTVHGEIQPVAECIEIPHVLLCSIEDMELTDLIKTMYAVDNFGMTTQSPKMAEEDTRAVDIMNRTIKCIGDRYEVGQLYKFNHFTFPDSKPQALRRLKVMEKKMDADPEFADQYCNKIEDYLQKGYARKLTGPELLETPNTWYLPHFSVCSAKKFRLVMDAKAKSNGFSLNDLLLKGPDLVPPLIAVLMRGRRNKIAFMADIQEMFHQVRIRPEDQNSQRFFWRGMERKKAPDVYVMQAMIFGAVSSPCIAQYIKNFNANRLDEALPGVREAALCQHYVDDYFDCRDTEGEAIQLINNVIEAHRQGGFKLVKFVSNSVAVMKSIDSSLKAADEKECRVLGLKWDLRSDEFVFPLKFSNLPTSKVITKRQLLKFMMSIFDPLGVLGPITIHLKILFQDLWRLQIDWDDDIPDGLMTNWNGWLEQIGQIGEVRIPRYYFPRLSSVGAVELHAFCDASDKAFACVVYMVHRIRNVSHVALIIAKSKVAPLKAQTVPRLELQSCVTGSQMVKTIQDELKIEITSVHFWTDSRICLGWLNSTQKLTAYVGSRVTKIKENGHNSDLWKWIPSNLNVADFGTKNSMFCNMNIWLNGPEFLRFDQEHWPKQETLTLTNEEAINFNADIEVEDNLLICLQISTQKCFDLPDITRFSDFNRLTRSTAYYLKMLKILALPKSEKPERFSIDVNDINQARMMLYQKVQAEAFGEELVLLKKQDFVKRTSRLFAYSPFLHEGIIRMRGRVQDSSQPFEVNNPVILPDNHHFTNLLIKMYHIANGHQGTETIINNLNQRHRILKIRSQVKKFARTCLRCCELRANPKIPQMGNLPPERTTPFVFPFTYTGIDYFGPLTVKVGRRTEKRWVALFTCLSSRALHLEVVPSLDTSSCLMAIRCFMSIRGIPQKILTDNGTNFVGADRETKKLLQELDLQQIADTLSVRGVQWAFIPPGAPHFGGCWERLVRSVKTALRSMLKDRHPSDLVLRTALCEVMNVVNNRPLTHVPEDPQDPEPITPNMILLGRNNHMQYDHDFDERDLNCRAAYKHAQIYADRFWRKWVSSYRPELLKRHKWQDNRNRHEYAVGDLVMIVDENMHRGCWPRGIIDKVMRGTDGNVRTVSVRTAFSSYVRPVTKIIVLQPRASGAPEDVADNEI